MLKYRLLRVGGQSHKQKDVKSLKWPEVYEVTGWYFYTMTWTDPLAEVKGHGQTNPWTAAQWPAIYNDRPIIDGLKHV